MREQPTSNNSRNLSEKNVTNMIKNMLCWNTNTNRWNQTYPPNDSKKHATEGPIHTNHTQWCLQEKQIGTTNNPNSENLLRLFKVTIQKMGTKQWYTQNCLKKPKPSRQKTTTTTTTTMHPPTTCRHDHTANQIGNHATRHPRKNNRKNNPKATIQTIWILCKPKLLYPPQLHQYTI